MTHRVPKKNKTDGNRWHWHPPVLWNLSKPDTPGLAVYCRRWQWISDAEIKKWGKNFTQDRGAAQKAEMIIKVKEPIAKEYKLIKKDQLLFTYFHFVLWAIDKAMIKSGAVCLAYETGNHPTGRFPLLIPMSEVAGKNGHPGRCQIPGETHGWKRYFPAEYRV